MSINRLDLNLIKVFIALFEEGSVTVAGEKLGLAQSSMSHALTRLRDALDDQLFVRGTTGMMPTPYAITLAGPFRRMLNELQIALDRGRAFDPETSDRVFTLIMTDAVEMILLPKLMARLAVAAPHVQIVGIQLPRNEYREALESGRADLALGQLPPGHTDFLQQTLLEQGFACFTRVGHPLAGALDLDQFLDASHLVVSPPAMAELHVKRALGPRAARRNIAIQVPHYTVTPFILATTDLIAVLPVTLSDYFLGLGTIARTEIPFAVDPVMTRQFWHERSHEDVGCQWLRHTIADLLLDRQKGAAKPLDGTRSQ